MLSPTIAVARRKTKASGFKEIDEKLEPKTFTYGLIAMLAIIGALYLMPLGSTPQRLIFAAGSVVLFFVAYYHKQRVLAAVGLVVLIGTLITFLNNFATSLYLALMMSVSVVIFLYLVSIGHYRREPFGIVGTIGFFILAFGYAVNGHGTVRLVSFLFGSGSLLIAVYSSIAFIKYKAKIQIIWIVLNLAFALVAISNYIATLA